MSGVKVDLGDMENEVRSAEEAAKKALSDSQRLTEDLRRQQDAASSSEKQRRTIETQASQRNVAQTATVSPLPPAAAAAMWCCNSGFFDMSQRYSCSGSSSYFYGLRFC